MNQTGHTRRLVALCLLLSVATVAAYWPLVHCDFVSYDDPDYIIENDVVKAGLTGAGVIWAFQGGHAGNWHPLTWLSHMLDVSLFGLNPAGHHLTNLFFHVANSVLLLLVLRRMTGAIWRSAFVAALFAVHPLHVESVAWVAERKDVLSTFFGLLTLWAYAGYVQKSKVQGPKSKVFYGLALLCFALGLMCKPMLVTWPFVLLLLDWWPLGRVTMPAWKPAMRCCLREKIPFFLLSAASAGVTYAVQSGAGAVSEISLGGRIANALIAYVSYLAKIFAPLNLAVFYPLPKHFPVWQVAGAVVVLIFVSVAVIRSWRRAPEIVTGWFWFLGTLVPVIGLVQVGQQAMADRYSYIPAIGIFIIVAWGLARWVEGAPTLRWPLAATGAVGLLLLAGITFAQLAHWQNSVALYEHALRVTQDNHVAHNNLSAALQKQGRFAEAQEHATEALRISPNYADAHVNLGNELGRQGHFAEAREHLERARQLKPQATTLYNLANLLRDAGQFEEAESLYRTALARRPDLLEARYNLALCLYKMNRLAESQTEFETVLATQPAHSGARLTLGTVLAEQKRFAEAATVFQRQVEIDPDNADARFNLGNVFLQLGQPVEARQQFEIAVRSKPNDVPARLSLAATLAQTGQLDEAIAQFREALRRQPDATINYQLALALALKADFPNAIATLRETIKLRPDWPLALNDLAWLLGTAPDAAVRKPAEAVQLAQRACELTENKAARCLGTLDAAYAANGQFAQAIEVANKVVTLAQASGEKQVAQLARERLALYQSGKPYVQVMAQDTGAAPTKP